MESDLSFLFVYFGYQRSDVRVNICVLENNEKPHVFLPEGTKP